MPRRKQEIRRRTGCFQCKEKHIQCTEEHPRCRRCEIHNLECVRGLRLIFREDAIQRGIKFGREGVWTKRPGPRAQGRKKAVFEGVSLTSYINRWVFLNLTLDDFPEKIKSQAVSRDQAQPQPHAHLPLTPGPPSPAYYHPLHTFPYTDGYLLDYFITGISPSCSLSASHNPYLSLVIPLCFVSVTLRNALLAVAANQLCLLGHAQFTKQACYYKQKALQGLRQEISTGFPDEGTVAAVLMLCFQDISDGCSPSWITHLRGGLQLIDCNTHQTSPSLWNFFRMYFVAHDIMGRTASDDYLQKDEPLPLWSETDDLDEVDVLMGCSRGLMTLINRISILASTRAKILKERHLTPAEITEHAVTTSDLCSSLLSLKQTLPTHSIDRQDLERVAHVKQLAALLYLNERLGSVPVSAPIHHTRNPSASTHPQNPPNTEETEPQRETETKPKGPPPTSHLISSIISTISTLPNMTTLLWPLFVLGNVALENEHQRRFVLDRLAGIQRARNLGSVCRAIEAVKHSFRTRDLGLQMDLGSPAGRGRGPRWGHESYRFISLA